MIEIIRISSVCRDGGTPSRALIDEGIVSEYKEEMRTAPCVGAKE